MTPVTIILFAVIVAVILIDLYLKRKNKLATTKEIEKVVDKENPEKKKWWKNKVIVIISSVVLGAGLVILIPVISNEVFNKTIVEEVKDDNTPKKKVNQVAEISYLDPDGFIYSTSELEKTARTNGMDINQFIKQNSLTRLNFEFAGHIFREYVMPFKWDPNSEGYYTESTMYIEILPQGKAKEVKLEEWARVNEYIWRLENDILILTGKHRRGDVVYKGAIKKGSTSNSLPYFQGTMVNWIGSRGTFTLY